MAELACPVSTRIKVLIKLVGAFKASRRMKLLAKCLR